MIPLVVKGVVQGFHCSDCAWSLILDQPFFTPTLRARLEPTKRCAGTHLTIACGSRNPEARQSARDMIESQLRGLQDTC